ncbi:MAG: hypothetical protein ACOZCE_09550 [Spirochaetota bacterium]|jgi:vacuolar-type H+-ATPase subunit H|uniref:hypothetical protein n=1 Tax=Gracilinema caldarium TaxID=215591 RepID=UPI0016A1627A|nr:hypothetical protein [Gracilinema caldarium]NLJ11090.1 hypothetical protein [Treponema sp.]HRS03592.1 hypothetical protein [Treponema sp.]HRU28330.1 hypothetical protein [Treponema sp.]
MDEQDVLQHLLDIENQASYLVQEAQKEADRRIAEQEKISRETYEKSYKAKSQEFEQQYQNTVAQAKKNYADLLQTYKQEIEGQPVQYQAFNDLMHQLLFGGKIE